MWFSMFMCSPTALNEGIWLISLSVVKDWAQDLSTVSHRPGSTQLLGEEGTWRVRVAIPSQQCYESHSRFETLRLVITVGKLMTAI